MKKIDLHVHVSLETVYKNGKTFVSCAEDMLRHMDELEIEKAVLMSGGESPCVLGSNADNCAISLKYPDRFAWMCNVDEQNPDCVYDRLAKCKEQGAIGIGELMQNRPLDDPFLQEVFRAAQQLHLPVLFHMSPEVGFNYGVVDMPGLPLLEKTLNQFPEVIFIGHSQPFWVEISGDAPMDPKGRNAWGKGPVIAGGVLHRLFETYPNLYGDVSANSGGRAIMRDEAFGISFLENYAGRIFFATDMLNAQTVMPLAGWMEDQVALGNLSQNACEKIFYQNAQRIFGL